MTDQWMMAQSRLTLMKSMQGEFDVCTNTVAQKTVPMFGHFVMFEL